MRVIRLFLLFVLAVVLILVALANRDAITIHLVPENLARFVGGQWSLTVPAFLILFLAMAFGLVVGLVWEWLRESGQRAAARTRSREVSRLEREVGDLRRSQAQPNKDDVLAILEDTARPSASAGLPATR